jgi:hypothetical protein
MANEISNETGKAYDVTVAPLVNAWGFGFKHSQFPDSLTIDSLRQFVGIDKVQLNAEGEVVKADPRMMLDFSSIAKGFGVDCVARLFDRKGIKNYMIDIGGELVLTHRNIPYFINLDCGTMMFYEVTGAETTTRMLDSLVITNPNIDNYEKENFKIYFTISDTNE